MTRPRKAKSRCTRFDGSTRMPPLRHQPGTEFSWTDSEVVAWLVAQPEIRRYVFDRCRTRGLIVFDPETRTWRGRDFKPEGGAERYRF